MQGSYVPALDQQITLDCQISLYDHGCAITLILSYHDSKSVFLLVAAALPPLLSVPQGDELYLKPKFPKFDIRDEAIVLYLEHF